MIDEDDSSYEDDYSEHDGMKSRSEFNRGIHLESDEGCKSHDDYGGKKAGSIGRGHYEDSNWFGRWTNEDDEDNY